MRLFEFKDHRDGWSGSARKTGGGNKASGRQQAGQQDTHVSSQTGRCFGCRQDSHPQYIPDLNK